jgi:hypothetical protein
VREPVAYGLLFGLTPFGLLTRGAEIDNVAHVKLSGIRMLLHRAILARLVLRLIQEDGNSESLNNFQQPSARRG